MIRRMIGAANLRPETFEEIEADPSATKQAMLVVIIVALATGIGALGTGGLYGLAMGIITGLLGWGAWAVHGVGPAEYAVLNLGPVITVRWDQVDRLRMPG